MIEQNKSVAIITSTIGRPELKRAIESVKNQTYACKHYIFVDGEQFAESASAIIEQYDDLVVTYLPMNTGANGWVNSSINAIAPYLVKEDIVCYLDDDNWYEPHHIQSIIDTFNLCPDADFVYSLRNFANIDGTLICEDNFESLGIWKNKLSDPYTFQIKLNNITYPFDTTLLSENHIDTNCYAFKHHIAIMLAPTWYSGVHNDKYIFRKACELGLKCMTTKQYTLNYVIDLFKVWPILPLLKKYGLDVENDDIIQSVKLQLSEVLKLCSQENINRYGGHKLWVL